jgi:hypothetical protein
MATTATPGGENPNASQSVHQLATVVRRAEACQSRGRSRDSVTVWARRARPARARESLVQLISRTWGIWKVEQAAVANGLDAGATLEEGFAVKVPIRQRYTERRQAK